MTFMLPSDDRNTYRDFRLPFLERLRMVGEALPDDQRPLVDRAVIELTAMQPPAASTVKLLAGPAVQGADLVTYPTGYQVTDDGDILKSDGTPHTGYVSNQHLEIAAERKAGKRTAPKPKKKSPKK